MSEKFEYEYKALSIHERREIESIRDQYTNNEKEDQKIRQLREFDLKVKNIPTAISLTVGIAGILIFGLAMTFFLEWVQWWFIGFPCGIIGIAMMVFAYPLNKKLKQHLQRKYGPKILQLADELLSSKQEEKE